MCQGGRGRCILKPNSNNNDMNRLVHDSVPGEPGVRSHCTCGYSAYSGGGGGGAVIIGPDNTPYGFGGDGETEGNESQTPGGNGVVIFELIEPA